MTQSATNSADERRFRQALIMTGTFVAVLWLVHLGAALFDLNLVKYGIYTKYFFRYPNNHVLFYLNLTGQSDFFLLFTTA